MLKPATKSFVLSVLRNNIGDDHIRAQMAFQNLTNEQMNQEYGQSGQTCKQILDGYLERKRKIEAMIKEFEENT